MNGMYIGHKISHLFYQPLSYKYLDSGTPSGQVEMAGFFSYSLYLL